MTTFNLVQPRMIAFGEGRIAEIGQLAAGLGRRVALVTGRGSLAASGRLASIEESLRAAGLAWHRVIAGPEPTVEQVEALLDELQRFGADCVVAVGGGSVIDVGKALAALLANGGGPLDYIEGVGRGRQLERPALPVLAAPTTAGTGSEATFNAVLGDRARSFKKSIRHAGMMPSVALVDPGLLSDCPAAVTAACGMDALAQLIESYVSRRANPLTDSLVFRGLQGAPHALRRLVGGEGSAEDRAVMALASLTSGICLANAGLGAVHALASSIGARFDAPHGAVCAALLSAVVGANMRLADEESDTLAKYSFVWLMMGGECGRVQVGGLADDPDVLAEELASLRADLGIPGLAAWGVERRHFDELIDDAGPGNLKSNPVDLGRDDLADILEASL